MLKRFMFALSLGVLSVVLLVACASPAVVTTAVPSTAPKVKPPPVESLTRIVGYPFEQLWGNLLTASLFGAVLVFGVAVALYLYRKRDDANRGKEVKFTSRLKLAIAFSVLVLVAITALSIPGAFAIVPADTLGVVLSFGEALATPYKPGMHFITPYKEQVALISTREFVYITTSHVDTASEDFPDYEFKARTCDGVEAIVPYSLKFKVIPETVVQFYKDYGSIAAVEERVVKNTSRTVVRRVPTSFSSVSLYASNVIAENPGLITDENLRKMLGGAICGGKATGFEALNTEINNELMLEFTKSGIQLTFFGLKQPDLGAYGKKLDEIRLESKNVEVSAQKALRALEDKKVTETNAEAEANAAKTKAIRKAEGDKESAILAAQGEGTARTTKADAEKNATITLAEGNADATKKLAEATAEANTKIAKSLTPELAYYNLQMELFKRWSGQVPQIQITQPVSGTNGIAPVIVLPAK